MKTALMPTQVADVEKQLDGDNIPNFSEAGTGKTLTTIGALHNEGFEGGVVVCPPIACMMWRDTLEYELGAKVQWLKKRQDVIDKTADFHVMSYSVLPTHAHQLPTKLPALIVDESQYIKNRDSQRTMAIMGADGLVNSADYTFLLSGTPIERHADDLWSQLHVIQYPWLRRYNAETLEKFQMMFCRMREKEYGQVKRLVSVDSQNEKLLNRMLYNDIGAIRRTRADVDPFMPPVTASKVAVEFSVPPELRSLLVGMTEDKIITLMQAGDATAAKMRRLTGIAKAGGVVKFLRELPLKEPRLVGFWHTEVGVILHTMLESNGFSVATIDGSVSAEKRDKIRKRFMAGDIDFLLGQIAAMGIAMDGLQHASKHVVFAELEWSGAKTEQFYKRVARKGQTEKVHVDYCMADLPVDDALYNVSTKKSENSAKILDNSDEK